MFAIFPNRNSRWKFLRSPMSKWLNEIWKISLARSSHSGNSSIAHTKFVFYVIKYQKQKQNIISKFLSVNSVVSSLSFYLPKCLYSNEKDEIEFDSSFFLRSLAYVTCFSFVKYTRRLHLYRTQRWYCSSCISICSFESCLCERALNVITICLIDHMLSEKYSFPCSFMTCAQQTHHIHTEYNNNDTAYFVPVYKDQQHKWTSRKQIYILYYFAETKTQ